MTVIRTTIDRLLTRINAIGRDGEGWTRPSYSDLETAAHDVVAEEARALGLSVHRDAAGNLFARLPGRDRSAPAILVGSHLDTVAQGGAYDGQAGVMGGLALMAALVDEGRVPPVDIVLTVTRAEESVWFPASYLGSRAALGRLTRADLGVRRSDTGRTLADHMCDQGLDPEAALQTAPPPPARFVEIHIEQGPILHQAGESHAVVTGVRGGLRHQQARIHGIWAHSGAKPLARPVLSLAWSRLRRTVRCRCWEAEVRFRKARCGDGDPPNGGLGAFATTSVAHPPPPCPSYHPA